MSTEPLSPSTTAPYVNDSERGLLLAVLIMVLLGTGAILLMS